MHIAWAGRHRLIPYRCFGDPMHDLVRGAQFGTLAGVGHVPMYDDPALVARTVLDMTTRVDELAATDSATKKARRKIAGLRRSKAG